jgi:sec-independent protein translocase protein TatA
MGDLSPWHLLILAGIFVLLFGARKLPDAARSAGRSMRIFKSELRGMHEDEQAAATQQVTPAAPLVAAPPASTIPAGTPVATGVPVVAASPPAGQTPASQPVEPGESA